MPPAPQLHFFDLNRWFIGLTPPWFLLEVLVRTILIYLMLQVVLRLIGRRVASQMTAAELGVIVTIAAAIGVPMLAPDRGMLAPVIILALVLLFQRAQGIWHFYSAKSEQASMGDVCAIIKDGRILMENLSMLGLSHDRLFSVLRSRGILHLGQVQRGYVEVTGAFSLYKFRQPPSGLSILPETDLDLRKALRPDPSHFVCSNCGDRVPGPLKPEARCFHCQYLEWTVPVWADLPDSA